MSSFLRNIVSGPKARLVDEALKTDLDMAYITDNLIIMGWPASSFEAIYRNSRKDVKRYLDHYHNGKYRVYNLCPCAENSYDAKVFEGRVSRYPFPDHHPPPLSLITMMVIDITAWLDEDPENVAVIHCKAGKGRSGTMACSYLLSLPVLPSAPREARKLGIGNGSNDDGKSERPSTPPVTQLESSLAKAANASLAASSENNRSNSSLTPLASSSHLPVTVSSSTQDLDARLRAVFELHSSRRLRPKRQVGNGPPVDEAFLDQGPVGADSAASSRASSSLDVSSREGADGLEALSRHDRVRALGSKPSGVDSPATGIPSLAEASVEEPTSDSSDEEDARNLVHKTAVPRWAVSIPSQRRFVGYWARILGGSEARQTVLDATESKKVLITRIDVDRLLMTGASLSKVQGSDLGKSRPSEAITLQFGRYDQTFEARLTKFDRDVREGSNAGNAASSEEGPSGSPSMFAKLDIEKAAEESREFDWGDTDKKTSLSANNDAKGEPQLEYFAVIRESSRSSASKNAGNDYLEKGDGAQERATEPRIVRHTYYPGDRQTTTAAAPKVPSWARSITGRRRDLPSSSSSEMPPEKQAGIVVEADSALMIKVLSGRSGASHALLPDMASCGYVWFIPSFETPEKVLQSSPASSAETAGKRSGGRVRCSFGPGEIDFRKGKRVAKMLGGEVLRITVEWEQVEENYAPGAA